MSPPPILPLVPAMGRWLRADPKDPEVKALLQKFRASWLGQGWSRIRTDSITLVTPQADALCMWCEHPVWLGEGVCLGLLHNESRRRVYKLLGEASEHAEEKWPDREQVAYLNRRAQATRAKTLRKAGWSANGSGEWLQLWMRQRSR